MHQTLGLTCVYQKKQQTHAPCSHLIAVCPCLSIGATVCPPAPIRFLIRPSVGWAHRAQDAQWALVPITPIGPIYFHCIFLVLETFGPLGPPSPERRFLLNHCLSRELERNLFHINNPFSQTLEPENKRSSFEKHLEDGSRQSYQKTYCADCCPRVKVNVAWVRVMRLGT